MFSTTYKTRWTAKTLDCDSTVTAYYPKTRVLARRSSLRIVRSCGGLLRLGELTTNLLVEVHDHVDQEVLAAATFLRILQGFQATVILAKFGLVLDSQVVLRGVLESLFILKLICEETAFVSEYVGSDSVQRLKWMNIAHQSKNPNFDSLRNYATPEVREKLRQEIAKHDWKELKVEEIARRAGLSHVYDTDYRILSAAVHTLPRVIESMTSFDDTGGVTGFNSGPSDEGLDYVLFTAQRTLFMALVAVAKLFGLNRADIFAEINDQLSKQKKLSNS